MDHPRCEPFVRRQERRLVGGEQAAAGRHLWNTGGYANNTVHRVEVTVYPVSTPGATEA